MDVFAQYMVTTAKYVMIILSLIIMARCIRSMLSEGYDNELWAYVRVGKSNVPVNHWENIIGRSRGADIRVDRERVSRVHAVLKRSDRGVWTLYDIFSKGGVWVNDEKVGPEGTRVLDGDIINLAGNRVRFVDVVGDKRLKMENKRFAAGKNVSPALTLAELTVFQLFLLVQHMMSAEKKYALQIALGFAALILLQWAIYYAMRVINRSGFEVETLAFYLTTLGLSVTASSTPDDMFKQIVLIIASVLLFALFGWWLRSLKRTSAMRIPAAIFALALLAVNIVAGTESFGARNWLYIGNYSFQPSEIVKVIYIYVGASTLDRLYRRQNLFVFVAFSAVCVCALALMGDFGTALVFFVSFLIISFMRSGSIATVILAVTAAGMAGFLAASLKPHIIQRFAAWGHVWEDVYDAGYQQTRAMSAAASGGLFGKGAGSGWLKQIFAADSDMVFALICEELGLIIGICAVLAIIVLAFFAVRSARHCRSAYYSIAACAATAMMLLQLALNVFGSLDILPFTGVTFPFVSKGGTSLIASWMMLAYIKGSDTRKEASFVVRPVSAMPEDAPPFDEEEDDGEEGAYI